MRFDLRPWLVAVLGILLLYLARHALAPFVIAAVLAYIFTPTVDTLAARTRLPRVFAVGLLYLAGLALAAGFVAIVQRPLLHETRALLREGPNIIDDLLTQTLGRGFFLFGQAITIADVQAGLSSLLGGSLSQPGRAALQIVEGLVSTIFRMLLCLIATFYLLLDGRRIGAYAVRFVPASRRADVVAIARQIHVVLGRYLRGQLLLIALMSTVTYVALTVFFGLRYSLPIAVASGFLEVIPIFGPVVAGTIAAIVGFAQGGVTTALGIAVLYLVLRQLEDQLVIPLVVGRAVNLHPLVTVFAVVAGETIAGVLGMFLAVPITAAARVVLDYVYAEAPRSEVTREVAETEASGEAG